MKKYKIIFLVMICSILFNLGCANKKLSPNQISYKGNILTYTDSHVSNVFNIDGIEILQNKDNKIRCITINNNEVVTYNNISVGDNRDTIESLYKYETLFSDTSCTVVFDNTSEVNVSENNSNNKNLTYINYIFDNDKIIQIQIYDETYAIKME